MTLKEKLDKKPESVIELAVKGMLPKGPLGRAMIKKLFCLCWTRASTRSSETRRINILVN